jgi:hypothetical protein
MASWTDREPLTWLQERELLAIARDHDGLPADGPRVDDRAALALLRRGLVVKVTDVESGRQRWVATLAGRDVAEQVA